MTTCRWNGSERPRTLPGRHAEDCTNTLESEPCTGCQPCPWPHCRRCGKEHAEHTCPGCLADARENLAEITRLCAALPAEATIKGVDSEAMNLLGPVADPERTGHLRASINVGRVPADWLEVADNELHPLLVLGTWAEAYIETFEHAEPERWTVAAAASYLDRNLAYASAEPDVPFEDFARDLSACRAHLERVLHDGEQVETGAPCMTCRTSLRRVYGGHELPWSYRDGSTPLAPEDCWACHRCKEWRSEKDYGLNVAEAHRTAADWLTAAEVEVVADITPATLRKRVERGDVKSRRDSGRTVYRVTDIPEVMATRHARAG